MASFPVDPQEEAKAPLPRKTVPFVDQEPWVCPKVHRGNVEIAYDFARVRNREQMEEAKDKYTQRLAYMLDAGTAYAFKLSNPDIDVSRFQARDENGFPLGPVTEKPIPSPHIHWEAEVSGPIPNVFGRERDLSKLEEVQKEEYSIPEAPTPYNSEGIEMTID